MKALGFAVLVAFAVAAHGQPSKSKSGPPAWTSVEEPILERLRTLRAVPDDRRAEATRKLAHDIRLLMSPSQLRIATTLAGLATEGDFGKSTLQEVAGTLAAAIERVPPPPDKPGQPAMAYKYLAQLIRYEHVDVKMNDPQLKAAFAKLDDNDKSRSEANFTLKDLSGKSWTLQDLRGSVVLVNFWATWCPPCRKEMPDLDALYKRFRKSGLVILSLTDEPEAKVRAYLADKHFSYPILLDPGRKVNDMFIIEGIPKSFVYNREGKLTGQAHDMRTLSQFMQMLHEAGLK